MNRFEKLAKWGTMVAACGIVLLASSEAWAGPQQMIQGQVESFWNSWKWLVMPLTDSTFDIVFGAVAVAFTAIFFIGKPGFWRQTPMRFVAAFGIPIVVISFLIGLLMSSPKIIWGLFKGFMDRTFDYSGWFEFIIDPILWLLKWGCIIGILIVCAIGIFGMGFGAIKLVLGMAGKSLKAGVNIGKGIASGNASLGYAIIGGILLSGVYNSSAGLMPDYGIVPYIPGSIGILLGLYTIILEWKKPAPGQEGQPTQATTWTCFSYVQILDKKGQPVLDWHGQPKTKQCMFENPLNAHDCGYCGQSKTDFAVAPEPAEEQVPQPATPEAAATPAAPTPAQPEQPAQPIVMVECDHCHVFHPIGTIKCGGCGAPITGRPVSALGSVEHYDDLICGE